MLAVEQSNIAQRIALVILRAQIKTERHGAVDEVPRGLQVAIEQQPMQWRVPQPIAVIEAGTQAVAGLQGFDIAVSRRQVDVFVRGA